MIAVFSRKNANKVVARNVARDESLSAAILSPDKVTPRDESFSPRSA
jgi:hypothetical protein